MRLIRQLQASKAKIMKKKVRSKGLHIAESAGKYSARKTGTDKERFYRLLSKAARPLPKEDA